MSRALITLHSQAQKMQAHRLIDNAPYGTRVEFKKSKRTLPQNEKFWAMLTDVSRQVTWHGKKLSPPDWKLLFMAGLKKEIRPVPSLDGTSFVNLGVSSSDLTVEEMGDMFALMEAFASQHGVYLGER